MYFFNVDNAWLLQFVHTMNRGLEYPPMNISVDLPGIKYQYGVVFLGYLLNRLPFLSAYQALLVALPITLYSLLFLVLYRMSRSIQGRADFGFLLILFILLFVRDGNFHLTRPIEGFVKITGVENNMFRLNQFTQLPALSGYLLIAALFHTVYFQKSYWISRSVFALIVFFKAAYFPMAMAVLGVEILYELHQRQKARYVFDISLLAATAAILKLYIQPNEYYDELTRWLGFTHNGPWVRFKLFGIINILGLIKYMLLAAPLIILRPTFKDAALGESMRKMVFVLIINVLILSIVYVDTPNSGQFTDPIGLLIVCLDAMAFAGFIATRNLIVTTIMAGHLFFFGISNLYGGLKAGVQTAFDPTKGHEYVNNKRLAEVLGSVKMTDRHLLATNDLRYPANGFSRPNRQFQMSSLFGHSFFNAEMLYSFVYFNGDAETRRKEYGRRKAVTDVLSDPGKSLKEESDSLRSLGITHVVLHLNYPHIDYGECTVIKRNEDYVMVSL